MGARTNWTTGSDVGARSVRNLTKSDDACVFAIYELTDDECRKPLDQLRKMHTPPRIWVARQRDKIFMRLKLTNLVVASCLSAAVPTSAEPGTNKSEDVTLAASNDACASTAAFLIAPQVFLEG
jgi:hypothetical protein